MFTSNELEKTRNFVALWLGMGSMKMHDSNTGTLQFSHRNREREATHITIYFF